MTGVTETVLTFAGNWAGTGAIAGAGDAEYVELDSGEYMDSECVDTGSTTVTIEQNHYDPAGDDVGLYYRHGATEAACYNAVWQAYVAPFASLGYIQVRLDNWTPADATRDGAVSPEHWYRADDAYEENTRVTACTDDGDVVGSWTDKTSNADHVSQATTGNKPTWQDAELNGKPVLRFDGSDDYLQGAFTTGGALSQPFTVFAVAKLDASAVNDDTTRLIIDGDDVTNYARLYTEGTTTPDKWMVSAGTGLTGTASDSAWNIWTALFNGASSQFWHNGVSEASGNAGAGVLDGLTVGALRTGSSPWKGDIAEIIIYDSSLSTADQNQVNKYLAERYGLSYTDIS